MNQSEIQQAIEAKLTEAGITPENLRLVVYITEEKGDDGKSEYQVRVKGHGVNAETAADLLGMAYQDVLEVVAEERKQRAAEKS